MTYERIKIMEVGKTKNFDFWSGLPISISSEALDDLVKLGNEKPIHCRYTHEGWDMLSGYIGKWTNFSRDDSAVYADFNPSEAVRLADGDNAKKLKQIEAMLQEEPEMLGCSVVVNQVGRPNKEDTEYVVSGFSYFWSGDMVGIPAATSSLYAQGAEEQKRDENNNPINKDKMSLFTMFSAILQGKKAKFAAIDVTLEDGSKLTIEKVGEDVAVGDAVKDAEGNPAADGDYVIVEGDEKVKLTVKDGVIETVEKVEVETQPEGLSNVPDPEYAAKIEALNKEIEDLKAENKELKEKASKFSKAPSVPASSSSHSDKKSAEELQSIRDKFRN